MVYARSMWGFPRFGPEPGRNTVCTVRFVPQGTVGWYYSDSK